MTKNWSSRVFALLNIDFPWSIFKDGSLPVLKGSKFDASVISLLTESSSYLQPFESYLYLFGYGILP